LRRFKFSLDAVLKVRRGKEEKLQLEYSKILAKRAVSLGRIAGFERKLQEMVQGEGRPQGRQNAGMIELYELNRVALIEDATRERGLLLAIEDELESKRLELVEASRERKVLEKLEEGQKTAYLEELNREEQAFLDELASHSSHAAAR
jgi:flagellar FliJ protein